MFKDDWQPQLRYSNNLDSMRYNYHISAPKPPGRTFATHFDLLSKIQPSFSTGDWHRLPDGSSRDHYIEKWLATSKNAKVMVETDDGLKWRDASKGSIILSERLVDETWKVSIPIAGEAPKDVEDTESRAGAADAA
jgi:hypothetical protein